MRNYYPHTSYGLADLRRHPEVSKSEHEHGKIEIE
jgi:hypothetical protein